MTRIEEELKLLHHCYPEVEYVEKGQWVKIKNYPVPLSPPWNRQVTDICFQIPPAYPGTPPYGFYVISGILYDGKAPDSYQEPAQNKPPFEGTWGFFSWSIDSKWLPKDDPHAGCNLVNFARTFKDRFLGGK